MSSHLERLAEMYEKRPESFRYSPEFIKFLKEEVEKKSWYERLCNFCGNILKIEISKEKAEKLQSKLNFCNLNIEPSSIYSTFILILLSTIFMILFILIEYYLFLPTIALKTLLFFLIMLFILGFGFSYYILIYPDYLVKKIRVEASSEIVLAILYMAIGLKQTPNLENAVIFSAINLPGILGKDLRKLIWDIHVGRYTDIEDALEDFAKKWKEENKEFSQAIDLLRASLLKPPGKEDPVDKAVKLILDSNMQRMKSYTRELKNPITVIHALGIVLPVITLILFPIVTVVMPNIIKPYVLVAMYDVLLPMIVFWSMRTTLQKRPYGFYVTDISKHPGASKPGQFVFTLKGRKVHLPLLPLSIFLTLLVSFPGVTTLMNATEETSMTIRLFSSLSIFWGIVIGVVFYTFFSTNRNMKIKHEVEEIEKEFGEAMFILGTVLGSGQPLETCLEKVNERVKDQKISGLFSRLLYTIRQMGVTLRDAVFNEEFGVIRYYPSRLIANTLRIMVESTKKDLSVAAQTLISVSQYLKSVKDVDEYLKELLAETTSSMKLLSSILVPLSAGVVVGMSSLLIMILSFVAKLLLKLPMLEGTEVPFIPGIRITDIMPIEVFLLVVGVYMIEVLVSLSIFTVQLEKGNDWVEMQHCIGTNLLRGGVIFTIVLLLIYFVFRGLIPMG